MTAAARRSNRPRSRRPKRLVGVPAKTAGSSHGARSRSVTTSGSREPNGNVPDGGLNGAAANTDLTGMLGGLLGGAGGSGSAGGLGGVLGSLTGMLGGNKN